MGPDQCWRVRVDLPDHHREEGLHGGFGLVRDGARLAPGRRNRDLGLGDTPHEAVIGSGLLRLHAAHACDLFDQPQAALPVTAGAVRCEVVSRLATTVSSSPLPISRSCVYG